MLHKPSDIAVQLEAQLGTLKKLLGRGRPSHAAAATSEAGARVAVTTADARGHTALNTTSFAADSLKDTARPSSSAMICIGTPSPLPYTLHLLCKRKVCVHQQHPAACLIAHLCLALSFLSTVQLPLHCTEKTRQSRTYRTGPGAELMTLMQDAGV